MGTFLNFVMTRKSYLDLAGQNNISFNKTEKIRIS